MLKAKTVIISGASRGIGRAIALRCAEDGANVGILARSGYSPSHSTLQGTLEEVAREVESRGGTPFIMRIDLKDVKKTRDDVNSILSRFGTIDAVVNNASAIYIDKTPSMDKFNTMFDINVRGTLNMILSSYKELQKSDIGHVLSISPPLSKCNTSWLHNHPPYSASKYAMTMITLGYSDALKANTLWPQKLIKTAATKMLEEKTGVQGYSRGGSPYRFASVAKNILCSDLTGFSGTDFDIEPNSVDENGIDDIFI